jgi:uncharacterized membrane protein YeaQ/YmgE (transglycosylase-associated protein family)
MGCLLILILLVLAAGAGIWVTVGLIGLAMTLLVAGVIGWAADQIIPGRLPGGWLGAVLAGILGGFVGHLVFALLNIGRIGPVIFGVDVVPAFVGAVLIAIVAEILTTRRSPLARY